MLIDGSPTRREAVIDNDTLGKRLIAAQSWYVGSELVRRHPELRITETHPGGGKYDCLTLHRPDGNSVVHLNRVGRMHVANPRMPDFKPISWPTSLPISAQGGLVDADARQVVESLEVAAGLATTPPLHASPLLPATLTYRVIARVLAWLIDDKDTWDARNERLHSSDIVADRGYLRRFPAAAAAARDRRESDFLGVPTYRFWALLRGGEPVAILDSDGVAYLARGIHHLPVIYRKTGCRLTATIRHVLGDVLP